MNIHDCSRNTSVAYCYSSLFHKHGDIIWWYDASQNGICAVTQNDVNLTHTDVVTEEESEDVYFVCGRISSCQTKMSIVTENQLSSHHLEKIIKMLHKKFPALQTVYDFTGTLEPTYEPA